VKPVYVPTAPVAHQRLIREQRAVEHPRAILSSLAGCRVEPITTDEAKRIILEYEWLGTIGRAKAAYGLLTPDGEVIGVAVFGWPAAAQSRDVCGPELRENAVCLERGACVHYAPANSASFLISQATRLAARDHGWDIFYAYADPEGSCVGRARTAVAGARRMATSS
jgi:hypothetical protein